MRSEPSRSSRVPRNLLKRKSDTSFRKVSDSTSKQRNTSAWLCSNSVPTLPCKHCKGLLLTTQAKSVEMSICSVFSRSKISGSASMHDCRKRQRPRMSGIGGKSPDAEDCFDSNWTRSSRSVSALVRNWSLGMTRQRCPRHSMAPTRMLKSLELCQELIKTVKAEPNASVTRRLSSGGSSLVGPLPAPPVPTPGPPPPEAAAGCRCRSFNAATAKPSEGTDSWPFSRIAQFTRATQSEHQAWNSRSFISDDLQDCKRGK
mmetsp:Transcript_84812/g.162314  ORF Transcript_84812/g.162314 Transcript_84812/m.162314 type:complete len:259 (-) Transcript_84812:279-1055(-)